MVSLPFTLPHTFFVSLVFFCRSTTDPLTPPFNTFRIPPTTSPSTPLINQTTMWRKLRNRRHNRRIKPAPQPQIPDAPPRPRTPSDSSPHITRSPSLPHSNPSPDNPTRARTDIGTHADTSALPPRYAIHRPNPVHPEHPIDRNRRLSLDGELPSRAIRPDDEEQVDDDSEALVDIQPAAFPPAFDVAGCSKAGWEPVRNVSTPVPPMHTVEVRKENQDAYCVFAPFAIAEHDDHKSQPQIFLGVFDGHGAEGRPIAHYARDHISTMSRDAASRLPHIAPAASPEVHRARLEILKAAFSLAERALTESDSGIDHVFSGTTAVVAWLFGRDVYTAWTGDSRCVVGRMVTPENGRVRFKAVDLSCDQKPMRADEKRRVRSAGGRIARWQRNMGPLRVWLPRDWTPGLAMTRSIGDTVLSEYGVSPVPEVTYAQLSASDSFMILASDGVWEFMTSQEVVDFIGRMRREGRSASESSEALVREAVRRWRRNEIVVDDTTAVVMWMDWEEEAKTEHEKKNEGLLTKPRMVFSRTKARMHMKNGSAGVHLVCDDGHLADFVCKNDTFPGI